VKKLDPVNLIFLPPEFLHSFGGLRGILIEDSGSSPMASPAWKYLNEGIAFRSIGV
jgi:hypothetical protein